MLYKLKQKNEADVAQLVELLICNQQVGGSSPSIGSKFYTHTHTHTQFGEIPERSNGADCKSVGEAFGGSNPPLPTKSHLYPNSHAHSSCGSSSFGRAEAFQASGGGFEPRLPLYAFVAQG